MAMAESSPSKAAPRADAPKTTLHGRTDYIPYDQRRLSYSNTFPSPWKRFVIRVLEWTTGKITLIRKIRKFEKAGVPEGQPFWSKALVHMGVEIETPADEIARIPAEGPVIIVANHPHGLVDGVVLAEMIGRVRTDYKILTRSLLTGIAEIAQFTIPVPFPHEEDAREKNLEMRRQTMEHLAAGGVIVIFPSGVVASSDTWWGPAIEREWNPFTAKMIRRSGATIVPIHFAGQNSRAYQIANRVSATIRQGLLLHEVVHALNKPQRPHIGLPFKDEDIKAREDNPRDLMAWMRDVTLALGRSD